MTRVMMGAAMMIVAAAVLVSGCAQQGSAGGSGASAGENAWRDTSGVDKSRLGPTGRGKYWVLEPGSTLNYKSDEGDTLVIRVTDETRVVDGVTTRVVEERETAHGKLAEISRNFMAIDAAPATCTTSAKRWTSTKTGK